uniref:Uncharacterized protein n=1 Tax=Anguilla anguilla TaxID=7936 RepID=A0A0E9S1K2_ANGAN
MEPWCPDLSVAASAVLNLDGHFLDFRANGFTCRSSQRHISFHQ